ncbi:hypothetical protein D8674_034151 [Pyrus ussuriensis x Pyrus communis]|uniref:Uncharacterized protein n=1 Tax=Pyrus ussuriensis x Pyrus communis TaxID=2448454 RepID=A0A5N5HN43_9ROSA|nr:hypothetical protein D8674_034151 [Pyrus ussuriensis x Pyrus communis]
MLAAGHTNKLGPNGVRVGCIGQPNDIQSEMHAYCNATGRDLGLERLLCSPAYKASYKLAIECRLVADASLVSGWLTGWVKLLQAAVKWAGVGKTRKAKVQQHGLLEADHGMDEAQQC